MTKRCLLFMIILLAGCPLVNAQQKVSGKVYSAATDSVISAVSIYNKSLKLRSWSASDGRYSIFADEGDSLVFSAVGYIPDTIKVSVDMLFAPYDITLQLKIVMLEMVKVSSNYYDDSVSRRNYYQNIFKKQPGITGFNRPSSGFGISLSPVSYFSAAARQKRTLKKRLLKEEQNDYIDRSFPAAWVERLTGLHGDSLNLFMYRYRPSYSFCVKTDRQEMLVYISDKLKEFKKPKK